MDGILNKDEALNKLNKDEALNKLNKYDASWHADEVARGERFEFGKNWSRFLEVFRDEQVVTAESSLKRMLEIDSLAGMRFLDIGSGSGLFSLAARRLGARVHSFDYDPQSVACTAELRRRYFPGDDRWVVEEGSALDADYVAGLGEFDIVYSWGVLHHTGRMWQALENARLPVAPGGRLFIAIYNDNGSKSRRWAQIKHAYNNLPRLLRAPFAALAITPHEAKTFLRATLDGRAGEYLRSWIEPDTLRGMSHWRDIVDWVGGYPYEFATPEQIFDFYRERSFTLTKLKCGGVGLGCNEFVFTKEQ
ncbi:MAG TPA: class I SAM-dependent methyltransferase [Blastocatellia bacterium]|nr:class I SAM-dependent methyltransferase [Blastocatellia bacterium]